MTVSWAEKWIGARAPDGIAAVCWWLVREIYRVDRGISLAEENILTAKDAWARLIEAGIAGGEWTRVSAPMDFDLILARADPYHVGILVGTNAALDLPSNVAGTTIHSLEAWRRVWPIVGVYRRAA